MRKPTALMKSILTNRMAQKIIDYVSPIYGDSYVGLWIYQAIGIVMDELYDLAYELRFETNAVTADRLLDYWEMQYGISYDSTLTKEQRRKRILTKKQKRGASNTERIRNAVSVSLGGVEVDITENVAPNTFLVNIREVVPSIVPAVAVVERMKPAHLVYQIRVATLTASDAEIKMAIAMTHSEQYKVEVFQ